MQMSAAYTVSGRLKSNPQSRTTQHCNWFLQLARSSSQVSNVSRVGLGCDVIDQWVRKTEKGVVDEIKRNDWQPGQIDGQ